MYSRRWHVWFPLCYRSIWDISKQLFSPGLLLTTFKEEEKREGRKRTQRGHVIYMKWSLLLILLNFSAPSLSFSLLSLLSNFTSFTSSLDGDPISTPVQLPFTFRRLSTALPQTKSQLFAFLWERSLDSLCTNGRNRLIHGQREARRIANRVLVTLSHSFRLSLGTVLTKISFSPKTVLSFPVTEG